MLAAFGIYSCIALVFAVIIRHVILVNKYSSHINYYDAPWPDSDIAGYTTPGWYVWDETLTSFVGGPFKFHFQARKISREYGKFLNSQYNASR